MSGQGIGSGKKSIPSGAKAPAILDHLTDGLKAVPFKKAGASLIELSAPPKGGQGVLRWWMEPSQLRALGKKRAKLEA